MDVLDADVVLMTIYLKNIYHILHIVMAGRVLNLFFCDLVNDPSFYIFCHNFQTGKPF